MKRRLLWLLLAPVALAAVAQVALPAPTGAASPAARAASAAATSSTTVSPSTPGFQPGSLNSSPRGGPAGGAAANQAVLSGNAFSPANLAKDPAFLYAEECASCHGSRAQGTARGPSLRGLGAAYIDFFVSTGRMPKQGYYHAYPQYKSVYTPAVIKALTKYVTGIAGAGAAIPRVDPAAGNLSTGEQLYMIHCATCHQWAGAGGIVVNRYVPPLDHTNLTATQIAEAIRIGPEEMPKFGTAAIPAKDLNSVVRYVLSLRHLRDVGGTSLSHIGLVASGAAAWFVGMIPLVLLIRWIGRRG